MPTAVDEENLLAEVAVWLERISADTEALAIYRAEVREIETAFSVPAADW